MNGSTPHILVVEDDRFVRELVEIYLSAEGYRVTAVTDGAEMRAAMAQAPADLVIMDLKLPGEDGLTLTRYLRETQQVGIVILTTRNDAVDRVVGLDCGADDYITKPFDQRELLARIRSVLRRVSTVRGGTAAEPVVMQRGTDEEITFHGYRLDPATSVLVAPTGQRVELTSNESRLLAYLARNPGRIMSRDLLMDLVLKRSRDPLDRSIDVLITRVRHKIENDPRRPALIKTVRGSGYVIPQDAAIAVT
ncbi:MAG: response regulator transcription factor [Rhodospirillaceae bacterium]|nr:response regulator transcription factor [Rhodospirillaceae bacterium]